jgi:hypothetical protein
MNQQKLAKLLTEMLLNGINQMQDARGAAWAEREATWSASGVRAFCRERANNIAQAMPELLAECEDEKRVAGMTLDKYKSMTDQCLAISRSSIEGVEPGDSL